MARTLAAESIRRREHRARTQATVGLSFMHRISLSFSHLSSPTPTAMEQRGRPGGGR
jgi:hypothetical protein